MTAQQLSLFPGIPAQVQEPTSEPQPEPKHPIAYRLGRKDAEQASTPGTLGHDPDFDPEAHAHQIHNGFSHPEIQIPQYIEGAKDYMHAHRPEPEPFPGRDWSEFAGHGEEYQDLARAVAYHMGADWTYHDPPRHYREGEPMPTCGDIDGPDGCGVAITRDWDSRNGAPRVSVRGNWPEDVIGLDGRPHGFSPSHHDEDNPGSITCATSRGPAAIAKDIKRRFLPQYLPKFAKQAEYRQERIARYAEMREAYAQLAEITGSEFREGQGNTHVSLGNSALRRERGWWGSVELSEFGDLDGHLKLRNVQLDDLLRIVRALYHKEVS